ncbi:MAG: hypothetical protein JWR54_1561 [Mucilaginibacter sp.]|nr:hypothetical protein [Mucilaginibacter sp.]
MKRITLLCGLALISSITFAQTIAVNGTVTDQKGAPIPFAFISDSQHPYATYSDPNGMFSLKADPSSKLIVTASHHPEVDIKIDNPTDVNIVMTGDSASSKTTVTNTRNVFAPNESLVDMSAGSHFSVGSRQENLHGSRFLTGYWMHGFAVSPKDSIKQNNVYVFNYDKISGDLLFTRDRNTVLQVVKSEIKGFTLFDDNAKSYVFEAVLEIDTKHYVQVLASGGKYKIYKNLETKFIKANYSTNGIMSTGNNYDEYKDESVYYVVKLPGGQPVKIDLRKKSIKAAFAADADKVNKFFSDNDKDIDDDFLKSLGDYMNQ